MQPRDLGWWSWRPPYKSTVLDLTSFSRTSESSIVFTQTQRRCRYCKQGLDNSCYPMIIQQGDSYQCSSLVPTWTLDTQHSTSSLTFTTLTCPCLHLKRTTATSRSICCEDTIDLACSHRSLCTCLAEPRRQLLERQQRRDRFEP